MNKEEFILKCKELNIEITDVIYSKLYTYFELLVSWNKKFNMTNILDEKDVFLLHFYDSLCLIKAFNYNEELSLCDFGTGAGFPGMIIALLFKNISVTLIESNQKKCMFLNEVKNQLDISNTSDENLILDENQSIIIENPQEKIDESSSESLESPEVIENQDSEEHLSLMINPENYESPDYVEFLPLIKENEIDLDFLEEEQNEDTIEELYEESNEIIIEESSEENIFEFDDTSVSDENDNIIENSLEETQTEEIIENQIADDSELIGDNTENSENVIQENQDSQIENTQNNENIEQDPLTEPLIEDFLPETEDIPLEEIFSPDESFVPLEPEETFDIKENRSMVMNNNQKLLVSFPGTGWIYLGDEYNSDILIFDKRDIYEDGTDFTLKSNNSGTALLHFFKQDLLTNEPINDYLLVTVNPKKGKLETIEAPEFTYSDFEEEIQEEYYEEEYFDYGIIEDEPEVMFFTDDSFTFIDENIDTKEVLDLGQAFLDDEMYIEALDQIDYYFTILGDETDEYTDYALFMKGQLLEKNTPIRNIKESLTAYKTLVENYPDSKYWNQSKERAVYLERFYFSVR